MGPKRKYDEWLKSDIPKQPRTSTFNLQRFEDKQTSDNEDVDETNNDASVPFGGDGTSPSSPSQLSHQSGLCSSESISSDSDQNSETSQSPRNSEREASNSGDSRLSWSDDASVLSEAGQGEEVNQTDQAIDNEPLLPQGNRNRIRKREELDGPLFPDLSTTKFDCYLMCLHYMLRHGLTTVALQDLFKLINALFGEEVINPSLFVFDNIFRGSFEMQFHFYCPSCKAYLGEDSDFDKDHRNVNCPNEGCETLCKLDDKMNGGSFFIYIPIESQLRSFLERCPDVWELLNYRFSRQVEDDCISDIFDGSIYKAFSAENQILSDAKNISISSNCDSSPVYKSVHNSMTPIQFRLNELPPSERFSKSNTMVAGIWFGKTEPEMTTFFAPFMKELRKLYFEGFKWTYPTGTVVTTRVVCLNCITDSIGRPKVQGTKQFNGYYGCNFCYHPGAIILDHKHPRYLIDEVPGIRMSENFEFLYKVTRKDPKIKDTTVMETLDVIDRTNDSIRDEMKRVAEGFTEERGVLFVSPFYALPYFDLVFGFSVDYMHAVLLGVTKFFTNDLLLNSTNKEEDFYVGLRVDEINERLLKLTPPSSVSWFPRSLKERAEWKANEWRMWLFIYSLVCLEGILKGRYLKHHYLLVTAIFTLSKDRIRKAHLEMASEYLTLWSEAHDI